jgi:hypothetical protein
VAVLPGDLILCFQTFWMFNGDDMMSVAVAADFGFAIVMTKLRRLCH